MKNFSSITKYVTFESIIFFIVAIILTTNSGIRFYSFSIDFIYLLNGWMTAFVFVFSILTPILTVLYFFNNYFYCYKLLIPTILSLIATTVVVVISMFSYCRDSECMIIPFYIMSMALYTIPMLIFSTCLAFIKKKRIKY
jgi:hypothetical protein